MIFLDWRCGARRVASLYFRAMLPQMVSYVLIMVLLLQRANATKIQKDWSNSGYPDVRGPTYELCAEKLPKNGLLYICDPDRILNATQCEFHISGSNS